MKVNTVDQIKFEIKWKLSDQLKDLSFITKKLFQLSNNRYSSDHRKLKVSTENEVTIVKVEEPLKPLLSYCFSFSYWDKRSPRFVIPNDSMFHQYLETNCEGLGWRKDTHCCYFRSTQQKIETLWLIHHVSKNLSPINIGKLPKPILSLICYFFTK